jgi:hypothetical protein
MRFRLHLCIIALLISFGGLVPTTSARATDIQMLPPTSFNSNQPCNMADGTGGILEWDGQTSIKCVPGVIGYSNGSVGIGLGAAQPQAALDVNGTIRPGFSIGNTYIQASNPCPAEGAIGYDKTSTTHGLVYCNSDLIWASATGGGAVTGGCSLGPYAPAQYGTQLQSWSVNSTWGQGCQAAGTVIGYNGVGAGAVSNFCAVVEEAGYSCGMTGLSISGNNSSAYCECIQN